MQKKQKSPLSNCRNPQDFHNPLQIIKAILEKEDDKNSKKPSKIKKRVIY